MILSFRPMFVAYTNASERRNAGCYKALSKFVLLNMFKKNNNIKF